MSADSVHVPVAKPAVEAFDRRDGLVLAGLLLLFVATRVAWIVFHPETASDWEAFYRWIAAEEWRAGASLPWLEYQADHYQGGSLVMIGLTAIVFAVAGPSILALKASALLFSCAMFVVSVGVLRRYFGRLPAWVAGGTLVVGPGHAAFWGLVPMGSHGESALFGWITLALFLPLLDAATANPAQGARRLKSWLAFGFAAGLGLWFCMTSAVALLACVITWGLVAHWPRWQEWGAALVGGALGLVPWFIYNLRYDFAGLVRPRQVLGLLPRVDPWPEPGLLEKGLDLVVRVIPVSLLDPSGVALPGWLQALCSLGFVAVLLPALVFAVRRAGAAIGGGRLATLAAEGWQHRRALVFVVYGAIFLGGYLATTYVVEPGSTVSGRIFTPFVLLFVVPVVALGLGEGLRKRQRYAAAGVVLLWISLAVATTGLALRTSQTSDVGRESGDIARGALLLRKHAFEIPHAFEIARAVTLEDPDARERIFNGMGMALVYAFRSHDSLDEVSRWLDTARPEERSIIVRSALWTAGVDLRRGLDPTGSDPTTPHRVERLQELVSQLKERAAAMASTSAVLPSIVLVTLDTTRVDHLSPYGYSRPTTPSLEAFAKGAVRFERTWSTSSWTLPAHASLFTGLYPARHGARFDARGEARLGEVVGMPIAQHVRAGRLAEAHVTLAERLQAEGYATGAFIAGPWLHRGFGLLQGFGHRDDDVTSFAGRPAEAVSDAAIAWLEDAPEPYFLFANYFDAHAPYQPLEGYDDLPRAKEEYEPAYEALVRGEQSLSADEREILVDRYDGEIRYMDHHLGRLLDAVAARSGTRPLIIITGDHGEAFGEEGRFGHTLWLSEELTRVPLLVRYPGGRDAGRVEPRPVQLVDVLPLVAAEIGLASDPELDGSAPGERETVISELSREPTTVARFGEGFDRDLEAIVEWPYKLVRASSGETRLFELAESGVGERAHEDPAVEARLLAALEARSASLERAPVAPVGEVDPEMLEALRRLGYVD